MNNTRRIKTFIGAMTLAGAAAAIDAGYASHTVHLYLGLTVLALAAATSRMKVKLPGIDGNMSVNLPFLLTAVVSLSSVEAVVIACVSTAVQCWPPRSTKINAQQITFNLSMMAFAAGLASLIFHADWLRGVPWSSSTMGLVLATITLFLGQTVPVAAIVAVSQGKSAAHIWASLTHLSFPYYIVSVGIISMVQTLSFHMGWSLALAVFPVMYGIYRSFQLYFGKMTETMRPEVRVKAAAAGA